jgi:ribulose-phosphate 3-epimerase
MDNRKIKIAPSILSADFAKLGEQVTEATKAGADLIHIDVMDGHFVPQITFGAIVVSAIHKYTNLPLDVHLMVESPEEQIPQFVTAGADIITIHVEPCAHVHRVIQMIKKSGVKAGISLNPATSLSMIDEILTEVDMVLVMTVNPGFGGQTFIENILDKIARLRAELDRRNLNVEIEVDGGINAKTAPRVVKCGATALVAGAAIFSSGDSIEQAIKKLRQSLV